MYLSAIIQQLTLSLQYLTFLWQISKLKSCCSV